MFTRNLQEYAKSLQEYAKSMKRYIIILGKNWESTCKVKGKYRERHGNVPGKYRGSSIKYFESTGDVLGKVMEKYQDSTRKVPGK